MAIACVLSAETAAKSMDAHEEDGIPKPQPSAAGMRRSSGGDASTTAVADDQQTPPAAGDTPVLKAKARRWGPEVQTAEAHLSPAVDGTPPPRGRSITLRDCKDGAGRDGSPGMKRDSSGTTRGGEHSGLPTNCTIVATMAGCRLANSWAGPAPYC